MLSGLFPVAHPHHQQPQPVNSSNKRIKTEKDWTFPNPIPSECLLPVVQVGSLPPNHFIKDPFPGFTDSRQSPARHLLPGTASEKPTCGSQAPPRRSAGWWAVRSRWYCQWGQSPHLGGALAQAEPSSKDNPGGVTPVNSVARYLELAT
ncbi:BAF chromatin remodeling complex subunit BCL11B a [Lates japonicus]|uniref:BAF chromatin remodeling complex subunit BCL11B a n=1 Tax=Lates japonicus TaxID=270547 RepID=A0AAD3NFG3_LATJO|nr:BAF chromatin remodeling complex subunit BCL11B a [Lates japonicus]